MECKGVCDIVNEFIKQYIRTALWSSTDPDKNDEPLDDNHSPEDIDQETLKVMESDCVRFYLQNRKDIGNRWSDAGYDFWLTRNHHGAGFWDGDWPELEGERLTKESHRFGDFTLYIGDDGKIHGM